MDYSHQQQYSQDEDDRAYYQYLPTPEQPSSQSWTDNSFVFSNTGSLLVGSPALNTVFPSTLVEGQAWQSNPDDLTQDINGFLNLRRTNNDPWTGQKRSMVSDQFWPHSFPGAAAPMSDPGQDYYHGHDLIDDTLTKATDSAYVSFDTMVGPSGFRLSNQAIETNFAQFHSDPMELQDYMMRPQQAESVVSDPMASSGYRGYQSRNRPYSRGKAQIPPCRICGKVLKNQSDALKHHYAHTKPYKCEVSGCSRYEGFATQNDLQRHRKAVHGLQPTVGRKTGYVCVACAQVSNGSPPKFWPRRDNFKAHVNRKHRDWNEQALLERSELQKPLGAITESGYVSAPSQLDPFEHQYIEDFSGPLEIEFPGPYPHQGEYPPLDLKAESYDDELAGVGAGTSADPYLGNRTTDSGIYVPSGIDRPGIPVLKDYTDAFDEPSNLIKFDLLESDDKFKGLANLQLSQPDLSGNFLKPKEDVDFSGESSLLTTPVTDPMEMQSKHPEGDFVCDKCDKRKKRECDLRKHMKRHTRPYGCTFQGCWKRFGSRNDWKRHENSQHSLQERYHCELIGPDGSRCNKPFEQRGRFLAHLRGPSHLISPEEIESTAESMRQGVNGHNAFWCGFCGKLIPSRDEPQRAWDFRFQHIGNHFDKDHLAIETWLCLEEGRPKGETEKDQAALSAREPGKDSVMDVFELDSSFGDDSGGANSAYILSTAGKQTQFQVGVGADKVRDYDDDCVPRSKMDWERG